MKQILMFFLLLFINSITPTFGQSQVHDFDYSLTSNTFIVFKQTVDSVATQEKKKAAKVGTVIENVVKRDTIHVIEGGLRYLTKNGTGFTVYDPRNPTGIAQYIVQYSGFTEQAGNVFLTYNILDKKGQITGSMTVDVFTPQVYLEFERLQVVYKN